MKLIWKHSSDLYFCFYSFSFLYFSFTEQTKCNRSFSATVKFKNPTLSLSLSLKPLFLPPEALSCAAVLRSPPSFILLCKHERNCNYSSWWLCQLCWLSLLELSGFNSYSLLLLIISHSVFLFVWNVVSLF
jgi:hypothetical protein